MTVSVAAIKDAIAAIVADEDIEGYHATPSIEMITDEFEPRGLTRQLWSQSARQLSVKAVSLGDPDQDGQLNTRQRVRLNPPM